MSKLALSLLALVVVYSSSSAVAAGTLRIERMGPCEPWVAGVPRQWCMGVRGMGETVPTVVLNGKDLAACHVKQQAHHVCFRLAANSRSGPIWVRDGRRISNALWLTTQQGHVLAPPEESFAMIEDRVVTSVDMVSLILSEDVHGLDEARRIARRYDLDIVGAIPALNVYQIRMRVASVSERNSLLNVLKADAAVAGVVVEDDNVEAPEDPERIIEPPDQQGWVANNFQQAVDLYVRYAQRVGKAWTPRRVMIGMIEKGISFDSTDFAGFAQPCSGSGVCLYARDSRAANRHGSIVSGVLAARLYPGGNMAFLSRLSEGGARFDIVVDRGANTGVTARVAASVNLVEDGAQLLNWSWGVHRMGTVNRKGEPVEANVRSVLAMDGYEMLLERFFSWLELNHPDVLVINSAGNSASTTADHLPASLVSDQLLVVGGHQRSGRDVDVANAHFVILRSGSNIGPQVDISAAACPNPPRSTVPKAGRGSGCGTSYAAAMVTGVVAAMLSINPDLKPKQIKALLRQSALPMVWDDDGAVHPELTQPQMANERSALEVPATGQFARLNMHQALMLAIKSKVDLGNAHAGKQPLSVFRAWGWLPQGLSPPGTSPDPLRQTE